MRTILNNTEHIFEDKATAEKLIGRLEQALDEEDPLKKVKKHAKGGLRLLQELKQVLEKDQTEVDTALAAAKTEVSVHINGRWHKVRPLLWQQKVQQLAQVEEAVSQFEKVKEEWQVLVNEAAEFVPQE